MAKKVKPQQLKVTKLSRKKANSLKNGYKPPKMAGIDVNGLNFQQNSQAWCKIVTEGQMSISWLKMAKSSQKNCQKWLKIAKCGQIKREKQRSAKKAKILTAENVHISPPCQPAPPPPSLTTRQDGDKYLVVGQGG